MPWPIAALPRILAALVAILRGREGLTQTPSPWATDRAARAAGKALSAPPVPLPHLRPQPPTRLSPRSLAGHRRVSPTVVHMGTPVLRIRKDIPRVLRQFHQPPKLRNQALLRSGSNHLAPGFRDAQAASYNPGDAAVRNTLESQGGFAILWATSRQRQTAGNRGTQSDGSSSGRPWDRVGT